ncbi:MAG: hypothetical protein Kow0089_09490 [Desulfobulbaceae bacterium]
MQPITTNPEKKELRNFGLITGAMVVLFFGLLVPWFFGREFARWPWITGGILAAWGLALPRTLRPVYIVWMTIGHWLGWINTRIILTLLFYLLILPVGVIMRLFGKDPLARSFDPGRQSYRVESSAPDKTHMERPY